VSRLTIFRCHGCGNVFDVFDVSLLVDMKGINYCPSCNSYYSDKIKNFNKRMKEISVGRPVVSSKNKTKAEKRMEKDL